MAATVDEETWGNRETALAVAVCHVSEKNRVLKEEVANLKKRLESKHVYQYDGKELHPNSRIGEIRVTRFFRTEEDFWNFIKKARHDWPASHCKVRFKAIRQAARRAFKMFRSVDWDYHRSCRVRKSCACHDGGESQWFFNLKRVKFEE